MRPRDTATTELERTRHTPVYRERLARGVAVFEAWLARSRLCASDILTTSRLADGHLADFVQHSFEANVAGRGRPDLVPKADSHHLELGVDGGARGRVSGRFGRSPARSRLGLQAGGREDGVFGSGGGTLPRPALLDLGGVGADGFGSTASPGPSLKVYPYAAICRKV